MKLMKLKNMLLPLSAVVSVVALADERLPAAPQLTVPQVAANRSAIAEPKLACPAGTKQGGGQASIREASFCERVDASGRVVIHGPFLSLHTSGKTAVEGQYADGKRTGTWRTYDVNGAKTEELTFSADAYSGLRTQWINGRKSIEETYVAGKRQGDQRQWDASGSLSVVRFVDDQPTAK